MCVVAVPLSPLHPASLLSYYLKDCQASLVMAAQGHSKLVEAANASTGLPFLMLDDVWSEQEPPGASDKSVLASSFVFPRLNLVGLDLDMLDVDF